MSSSSMESRTTYALMTFTPQQLPIAHRAPLPQQTTGVTSLDVFLCCPFSKSDFQSEAFDLISINIFLQNSNTPPSAQTYPT